MKKVHIYGVLIGFVAVALFTAYNTTCMHYVRKVRERISPRQFILSKEPAVKKNKYASMQAQLRFGNDLHTAERDFIEKRTQKVRGAIQKILNIELKDNAVPRIAVVCSGGGCRATLGTLGALSGLQDIGVLDATTYVSTLSGSTWAVGLWMATGVTLQRLKKYVAQRLVNGIYRTTLKEVSLMGHMLAVKLGFKQPCTAADLFGGFLANDFLRYFGDDRQIVHLSDQMHRIENGDVPFPIYTAVDGRSIKIGIAPWYEFTPFEIGSADYATYVPTWAFGRTFNNGVSTDYAPEQSLGTCFGIFGSAFATHAGHMWQRSKDKIKNKTVKAFVDRAFQNKKLANARIFWAKIPNFMYGIKDNEISDDTRLALVDAGLECNLPYLPVSGERAERKQDILIFFDFSKSRIPAALKKAQEYAKNRQLPFPVIDYTDIE